MSDSTPAQEATHELQSMGPNETLVEDAALEYPPDDRTHSPDTSGETLHSSQEADPQNIPPDYLQSNDPDGSPAQSRSDSGLPKQPKPNKVYIGGLPEHTRQEDLQNCFGKIGTIINIELKVGYGFVEFERRESAEESVAKYNEGYFMGNKIRVELSHGGGRTSTFNREPGACFRCGLQGHWARECPSHPPPTSRRVEPLPERVDRGRDYGLPPPPHRDMPYDYLPPPPMMRGDYRRPITPPREYRDYPIGRPRDYDDYRRPPDRDRYAPVPPPDYRMRYPEPPYRSYGPPPGAYYDRYDRRPSDRFPPAYPPLPMAGGRRTPPRYRDEYTPRDYPEYRGRPVTPPPPAARYPDYPRGLSPDHRYRRRSASPPPPQQNQNGGSYDLSPSGSKGNFAGGFAGASPRPSRDYAVPPPEPFRRA